MAKFPTMDEFAKTVATKVIEELEYEGKTIREWVELILSGKVTEVVNCKDCRFWECTWTATSIKNSHGNCKLEDADGVIVGRWDEDFCSYGERKDNATD